MVLAACRAEAPATLRVLAAASLTDALPTVAQAWSADDGMPVELVFGGTSRLAAQIEAGAPADVFFAADREWIVALEGSGRLVPDSAHDVLGNRLVVVVPKDASSPPRDVEALGAVGRLALAGAAVPAGRYARASLESHGVLDRLAGRIVEGDDVRTALGWVAKGEADAAIVYATDARVEPRVVVAFELPPESHPPVVYSIAVVAGSKHLDAARRFIAHLGSDGSATVFRDAGFEVGP